MTEVVFNTQDEAELGQSLDLQDHLATHCDDLYRTQTTRWATPRQRNDGKWAYPTCPHSDYAGLTVEGYDPANYQVEE